MKTGFVEDVMADMERGVYDFTHDGKCSNCGNCCSDILPITEKEIKRIRAYIKTHQIKEQKHFIPSKIPAAIDLICPFRSNAERKCVIYEVRPLICIDFRCDNAKKKIGACDELYSDLRTFRSMRETFFKGK